jgi:hypothetical protein
VIALEPALTPTRPSFPRLASGGRATGGGAWSAVARGCMNDDKQVWNALRRGPAVTRYATVQAAREPVTACEMPAAPFSVGQTAIFTSQPRGAAQDGRPR